MKVISWLRLLVLLFMFHSAAGAAATTADEPQATRVT